MIVTRFIVCNRLKRKVESVRLEDNSMYKINCIAGIALSPNNDDIIIADNHLIAFSSDGDYKVGQLQTILTLIVLHHCSKDKNIRENIFVKNLCLCNARVYSHGLGLEVFAIDLLVAI